MWFSPHHLPTPQYFFHSIHLRNCSLPLISSHMEEKQLLMYHFEECRGKKNFLCAWMVEAERPRKALQDIWKLIYKTLCIASYLRINILIKTFPRWESAHVKLIGGLFASFTVLNNFEKKKCVIKIPLIVLSLRLIRFNDCDLFCCNDYYN